MKNNKEILEMIARDMKNDAEKFDGQPFNGKTVATYFGNQGAAIAALANIVKSILKEGEIRMDESQEIKIMRNMAWERVKGELRSILMTYIRNTNFAPMNELVRNFIRTVDDEGYVE